MGEGTALTNEQSAAQLLKLPEQIAELYQDFAGAHARSFRETMRAHLSYADGERYEQVVDEAAIWRKDSEYYELCCSLIDRTLTAAPEEYDRYHRRYDALRGLSVSLRMLSALRRVEHPELPNVFENMAPPPFEAFVVHTAKTEEFVHWKRDQDPDHLDVNYLIDSSPLALVPFRKFEKGKRVTYFTQARNFLGGMMQIRANEVPLLESFASSVKASFPTMVRPFEREMLLLAGGYLRRAASVVSIRAQRLEAVAQFQLIDTAFKLHGITAEGLSPRAQEAYAEGGGEIFHELVFGDSEPDLPEVAARWAREIHQIEAGRVFRSASPVASNDNNTQSLGGIGLV